MLKSRPMPPAVRRQLRVSVTLLVLGVLGIVFSALQLSAGPDEWWFEELSDISWTVTLLSATAVAVIGIRYGGIEKKRRY